LVEPSVPFIAAWASRGKVTRAEPISALYEQGRVHYADARAHRISDQHGRVHHSNLAGLFRISPITGF
jgi:phage terminase large subunit-like protein